MSDSTFLTRSGKTSVPEWPVLLTKIHGNSDMKQSLCDLDVTLNADRQLHSAFDDNDHFGFNVTGKYEVLTFATQGTGSVFGFWYDCKQQNDNPRPMSELPIVFLDSEGFSAQIASNLAEFLSCVVTLAGYVNDVVSKCGYLTEESNVDTKCARMKELIHQWSATIDEDMLALRNSAIALGVFLKDDIKAIATSNAAIDLMFHAAGVSTPKFNPAPVEE
jgi:hypothetical protein